MSTVLTHIQLKSLYVAITRSRKNLWIVDFSDKAEPMKVGSDRKLEKLSTHNCQQKIWESKGLIQTCTPGGDIPRLAVRSGPEEWAKSGRSFFENRTYLQAMRAFERAGMAREAKISYSYHLRETARQIPATTKDSLARRKAFRLAASTFSECAKTSAWKEARVLLHNTGDCYEHAGNCGRSTEDFRRAAEAYTRATEFDAAVKLYRKIDLYDEAVEIIQSHRDEMDEELVESVLEVARLFYFKRKEYK